MTRRALLDTQVLLWALMEPQRLTDDVRDTLESGDNEILFSAASIWEIAIKASLQRVDFDVAPDEIAVAALETGFTELPVRSSSAALVAELPLHHRDPFDRLLIAQAISETVRLFTADRQLEVYSELVRLI
jgi:PIN domain nuclease of toxin-antitoxin system